MSVYFYVIEWHDGSGKTSGLTHAKHAEDAFYTATKETHSETGHGGHPKIPYVIGDVVTFQKVE